MSSLSMSEIGTAKAIAIVYLSYLLLGYGGIYLTFSSGGSLALLWLGSGVSLSALIIFGPRVWPAIWLGSFSAIAPLFVSAAPIDQPWSLAAATLVPPSVNVLVQSLLAYYLYIRLLGEDGFSDTASILKFAFIVITVPTIINSLLLVSFYSAIGMAPVAGLSGFLSGWLTAGLGDIHGYFLLTPIAITWFVMRERLVRQEFSAANLLFTALAFVALLAGSIFVPGPWEFLLVPLAVIVSLNYGLRGTVIYIFLMSLALTIATANEANPFPAENITEAFINLLVFVFSMGIPLLILASERNQVLSYQQSLEHQVEDRTRELSRAVAAKDEFLATISHELRTPLHSILGVVRILDKSTLTEYLKGRFDLIETAGESLLNQINGILTFIRFSSDAHELNVSDFSLKELVNVTAALMENTANEVGCEIGVSIDPNVPDQVNGSAEQLRQVIFNLMSNAVKYGGGAPIRLRVRAEGEFKIFVSVEDQGPGIPLEDQPYIFDRFTRVDPDQTKQKGTGLGLAISKRLVERMGGDISVESDGISGTTIRFDLTLQPPVGSGESTSEEQSNSIYRLLLLDDDQASLNISREFLEQLGHQVTTVETAGEAITALTDNSFDAFLSDINLPDMSGLELIRHIKLTPFRFNSKFNAALTASILPAQEASFKEAGFDAVLTKPLDRAQLRLFFLTLDRSIDAQSEPPILNEAFIAGEVESLTPDVYRGLVQTLQTQGADILESIKSTDNDDVLIDKLHLLASTASNFGLTQLQALCLTMETALREGDRSGLDLLELERLYLESIQTLLDRLNLEQSYSR